MVSSPVVIAVFYFFAALTLAGAAWVAFSRNIMHSAFALLATFFGVAGLYALLSADLMAVVQVLVYIGGILVLILFAVMLTSRLDLLTVSNPSMRPLPAMLLCMALTAICVFVAVRVFGHVSASTQIMGAADVGQALLSTYLLPFEAVSILLLAVLLGAVTIVRKHPGESDDAHTQDGATHPTRGGGR